MSIRAFLKRCMQRFFIITTCATVVIGILGLCLHPADRLGYDAFFSPLIFGALSLIPSFVTYSRKELSLRQTVVRKVIYILLLEGLLIGVQFWAGILHGPGDVAVLALAVLLVYFAVNWLSWLLDRKEAEAINTTLKAYQGRN